MTFEYVKKKTCITTYDYMILRMKQVIVDKNRFFLIYQPIIKPYIHNAEIYTIMLKKIALFHKLNLTLQVVYNKII